MGHAHKALEELTIHNKLVKGGMPSRSRQDNELSKLRNAWPKSFLERHRRETYKANMTAAINKSVLMSQLAQARSQMPAWGGPAHHLAHRDYILDAMRRNGTPDDTERRDAANVDAVPPEPDVPPDSDDAPIRPGNRARRPRLVRLRSATS